VMGAIECLGAPLDCSEQQRTCNARMMSGPELSFSDSLKLAST
jgi:hypothetical protein